MKKNLKGKLTITRNSNDKISIEVGDRASGNGVVTVLVDPTEFAMAITNLAAQECTYSVFSQERLGKKREVRNEQITLTDWNRNFEEDFIKGVAPLEVDGWKAKTEPFNHHKAGNGRYSITLIRYVDMEVTSEW